MTKQAAFWDKPKREQPEDYTLRPWRVGDPVWCAGVPYRITDKDAQGRPVLEYDGKRHAREKAAAEREAHALSGWRRWRPPHARTP